MLSDTSCKHFIRVIRSRRHKHSIMKIGNYDIQIRNWKNDQQQSMPFHGMNLSVRDLMGILGGSKDGINTSTTLGQAEAVAKCSVLSSIISKKAASIADARYWAKDAKDNDVDRPQEMAKIMRPNPYQSLSEFVCMVDFFTQIFGKAYILKIQAEGFADEFDIYVVPNLMVSEITTAPDVVTFMPFADVERYIISIAGGLKMDVEPENMFIVRDITYSNNRIGDSVSRLVALRVPINTYISAYEATNELLVNRGMLGIISLTSDSEPAALATARPATASDKKDLQDQLSKYGILRNAFKYAITSYRAAYTPVSSTIGDLGIPDIIKYCKKEIAYAYQLPSVLLDVEGATYSNYGEAKLAFYTDDVIPQARNIMTVINRIYGFEEFKVWPFFDHLELFQNAKRSQAQGLTSLVTALNAAVQSGIMNLQQAKDELNKYLI